LNQVALVGDASKASNEGNDNIDPHLITKSNSKPRKRKSDDGQMKSKPVLKKAKPEPKSKDSKTDTSNAPVKKAKAEPKSEIKVQDTRPRLTTPDLEFDYDRS
jgi:hypothetical protein